ncbi:MAG: hypothetical protein NTY95_14495 [Bacteroidia bacterium]|nr:hypothetical protein [Bacteroidia bacterium]
MKYSLVLFFVFALKMIAGWSINTFAKWTKTELVLDNGIVHRTIKLPSPEGSFITSSYKPVNGDFNYFLKTNTDFQFEVNVIYSGKGNWRMKDIRTIEDSKEGNGASVTLTSKDNRVELTINYLLYPNSPAILNRRAGKTGVCGRRKVRGPRILPGYLQLDLPRLRKEKIHR